MNVAGSILDNDFYKFTMQQCVVKLFPKAKARYIFINRGKHKFKKGFDKELQKAIEQMQYVHLKNEEKVWLTENCPYLDPVYLDFLQGYRFNPAEVRINQSNEDLTIHIEGYWYRTILWEVPVLSLVSALYYTFNQLTPEEDDTIVKKTRKKMEGFESMDVKIAEFGTRRRFSFHIQDIVVKTMMNYPNTFVGTSNVLLAFTYNTKPIGTHAHEWFMFHAAKYGFKMANSMALENWVNIYRGDLGIALSDTFTTDEFYEIFDKKFAKLFDGVRQDSGDPIQFAKKTIEHYNKLGIDPLSKTIIFSNSLDYEKVKSIAEYCKGKIGMSFGIGTNLTNDAGQEPLNIVIKMTEALPEGEPWTPVIKLSDDEGKHSGSEETIDMAKSVLGIKV